MPPKAKIDIPEAAEPDDYLATVSCVHPRRRAGHAFGPIPVHLTRAQLAAELDDGRTVAEAIESDPQLVIRAYKPEPALPEE